MPTLQERERALHNLLQEKGTYRSKKEVAQWVQDAQLPEFSGLTTTQLSRQVGLCLYRISKKVSRPIDEKGLVIAYIDDTETLVEELQKRLRYLKDLLSQ